MSYMKVTPKMIRSVRKAAKLSQEASARLMNVSVFSWHSWEQGRRTMQPEFFDSYKQAVMREKVLQA